MCLILRRFMHTILRHNPNTQPADFTITSIIKLALLVRVMTWHFHLTLHYLIIIIAVSFIVDILNLFNFGLFNCVGNLCFTNFICWNSLNT